MLSYRLLLEYDGTGFVGWQRQPNGPSVQLAVEEAVARVMGLPRVDVMASGRTDAGVHARGQVASFSAPVLRAPHQLRRGLNALLPESISCIDAARVRDGFHARYHARSKSYRYRILDGDRRSALRCRFVHCERAVLDVSAMSEAAAMLLGHHDFSSFRAAGSDVPTSDRTITRAEVRRVGDEVHVELEGDGFLRHMVRIVAGCLIEVGRAKRPAAWLGRVIDARDRAAAGQTAPARGLVLLRVDYGGADAPLGGAQDAPI